MGILLLNADYRPLGIVSDRRALSLLLRQRVDRVCGQGNEIRSPSQSITMPTVVRLRHYVSVPRRSATWSRRGVLRRDNYTCAYCRTAVGQTYRGRSYTYRDMTVDHVLPVSRGGKSTWGNTVCACRWCNQRKADRMPHEAGMPLLWEPKTPRTNYLVFQGEIPREWKVYLEV